METQTEKRLMDMAGGRKERVGCTERVTWTLTLPHVQHIASGDVLDDSGNTDGLCINLEACDGEGCGREVQWGGDICTPVADSCWCLAETNTIL